MPVYRERGPAERCLIPPLSCLSISAPSHGRPVPEAGFDFRIEAPGANPTYQAFGIALSLVLPAVCITQHDKKPCLIGPGKHPPCPPCLIQLDHWPLPCGIPNIIRRTKIGKGRRQIRERPGVPRNRAESQTPKYRSEAIGGAAPLIPPSYPLSVRP
jgi:hypothetical protein